MVRVQSHPPVFLCGDVALFFCELLLTKSVFVVQCIDEVLRLKKLFTPRNQVVADVENQPCPEFEVIGEVSLAEMLELRAENKYSFHGSPVKLEPGTDMLRPSIKSGARGYELVFVGRFNEALRFAMVRAWGIDQESGRDFFAYVSNSYRIVISAKEMGMRWRETNVPTYIYAVPRQTIEVSNQALPIVARAKVTPTVLRKNGFQFAVDTDPETTARWWWVDNTDEKISGYVLPDEMLIFEKQR